MNEPGQVPHMVCGRRARRVSGFTIIELLVTVVIVSVLASAAFPMAELVVRRDKEQQLRQGLRQIRQALDDYKEASDEGQIPRAPLESGYPTSLRVLVDGVVDAKDPSGAKLYFLRRLPRDPFFADPGVPAAQTWLVRSYASTSDSPKEGADVFDVYSSSPGIGLNGIAYREW